jgi:hypothetical protein
MGKERRGNLVMRVTCDGRTKNTAEMHSACTVKLQQNKADMKENKNIGRSTHIV